MKENIIKDKSLLFSIRIVNMYKFLVNDKKEFIFGSNFIES